MEPDREEARDIYNEILSKTHQCPLQKVSKCSLNCSLVVWWEETQLIHSLSLLFKVFDSGPSTPGPISVCSLPCGRAEELGRLQPITVAFPLGGTAYEHSGAESQTGLVLLHTLSRKFPAPAGKCLVLFPVCALRAPGSHHAFQHPVQCTPLPPVREWHCFSHCGMLRTDWIWAAAIHTLNLRLSKIEIVQWSLQLPFCCRYSWVCWGSPPGAVPSSCRTRAASFPVWSPIRMVVPLPRLLS